MVLELGALIFDGRKSDILYGASEYVQSLDEETAFSRDHIFIFDFSRSLENFISYDGLEKIKGGIWYSTKFKSKMCLCNPPRVICFANFPPNEEKMSEDRWNIINVDPVGEEDM